MKPDSSTASVLAGLAQIRGWQEGLLPKFDVSELISVYPSTEAAAGHFTSDDPRYGALATITRLQTALANRTHVSKACAVNGCRGFESHRHRPKTLMA
jgi:hypothetical protein